MVPPMWGRWEVEEWSSLALLPQKGVPEVLPVEVRHVGGLELIPVDLSEEGCMLVGGEMVSAMLLPGHVGFVTS